MSREAFDELLEGLRGAMKGLKDNNVPSPYFVVISEADVQLLMAHLTPAEEETREERPTPPFESVRYVVKLFGELYVYTPNKTDEQVAAQRHLYELVQEKLARYKGQLMTAELAKTIQAELVSFLTDLALEGVIVSAPKVVLMSKQPKGLFDRPFGENIVIVDERRVEEMEKEGWARLAKD